MATLEAQALTAMLVMLGVFQIVESPMLGWEVQAEEE